MKSVFLQLGDQDIMQDSVKCFPQIQVDYISCSFLIDKHFNPILEGHQIYQAGFAFSRAMLDVTITFFHVLYHGFEAFQSFRVFHSFHSSKTALNISELRSHPVKRKRFFSSSLIFYKAKTKFSQYAGFP